MFISFKYQRRFCATHRLIGKAKQNMIQQSASLRGSAGIRPLRKELSEEMMTPLKTATYMSSFITEPCKVDGPVGSHLNCVQLRGI